MPMLMDSKSERIDIRTTKYTKRLLQEAATARHKSISDFLLENGIAAAERTMADRTVFALDDKRWRAFQTVLDRPVKARPRLRKLLTEPGVFD